MSSKPGDIQSLGVYSDPRFADVLETWAETSAWLEIQALLGGRKGKVLDVACGTGRTSDFLQGFADLEYHGCDISELLIGRAVQRGIPADRVRVADATRLDYPDQSFDYVFSIGSFEHFTMEGLERVLSECNRVGKCLNFHMVPLARSGKDEGWVTSHQSYWNNSEGWWASHFEKAFGDQPWIMSSRWNDRRSRGVWFISPSKSFLRSSSR
jgi:ubiquinone/menaquinone biosynthesis C-methylase UbiE